MGYDKLYWYYLCNREQIRSSLSRNVIIELFNRDYKSTNDSPFPLAIFYVGGGGTDNWERRINAIEGKKLFKMLFEKSIEKLRDEVKE